MDSVICYFLRFFILGGTMLRTQIKRLNLFGFWFLALGLFLSTGAFQTIQAQVNIAQFFQRTGNRDFRFTNNAGTSGTLDTLPGGSPIFFQYQNLMVPAELQGIQNAHLTITSTTTATATNSSNTVIQPLNNIIVIRITRDTPASTGANTRRDLLSVSISAPFNPAAPTFTGADGGNSGTFSATTPDHTVAFTSDFIDFSSTTSRNLALSFTALVPSLAIGGGNFLATWSAAGTGTFAATFPTASGVSVSGRVLNQRGYGLGRVNLELRDPVTGVTYNTQTRGDGSFTFEDVHSGRTYLLTPTRKRYTFSPPSVLIQVLDEVNEITMYGQLDY
jgi:hypothetical protein